MSENASEVNINQSSLFGSNCYKSRFLGEIADKRLIALINIAFGQNINTLTSNVSHLMKFFKTLKKNDKKSSMIVC